MDAGYMNAYFHLGPQLRTQNEPAYCGLSSLVMILNAFAVDPGKVWKGVWRWYHEDMLECCTSLSDVKQFGVSMYQLSCIARCNQLESRIVYANGKADIDTLRAEIKRSCSTDGAGIIASFGRKVLGQTGTGHFAPIGGYHPKEDLVLLLEPARFKYPPFWISMSLLWEAMQTIDNVSGKPRGYLILKKSRSRPTLLFHLSRTMRTAAPANREFLHYMGKALEFLKQKVDITDSKVAILKRAATHLLQLTTHYDELKNNLLLTPMTKDDMRNLSPEHQEAIRLLVRAIESTELYEALKSDADKMICCDFFKSCKEINLHHCMLNTNILCFPHFLTVLMFLFPIFSPVVARPIGTSSYFSLSVDEYSGSYLEKITLVAEKTRINWQKKRKLTEESHDYESLDGRQLLLEEVDGIRRQIYNVINSTYTRFE